MINFRNIKETGGVNLYSESFLYVLTKLNKTFFLFNKFAPFLI